MTTTPRPLPVYDAVPDGRAWVVRENGQPIAFCPNPVFAHAIVSALKTQYARAMVVMPVLVLGRAFSAN